MLSVLIACQKVDEPLLRTIRSLEQIKPQILVDISPESKEALGVRKNRLISQAAYEWVLLLDTDEVVSSQLLKEIREVVIESPQYIHGYQIPYENYAFNRQVNHGGERYAKVRLFRKKYGTVADVRVHEEIVVEGKIGKLKGVIRHYSYRSLDQVLVKFTKYAWQMAGEKRKVHEGVTLKKLFLYGPHMVWARAVKDEGWRDGWRGIVIALCFGYMETLMYWLLLWRNIFQR